MDWQTILVAVALALSVRHLIRAFRPTADGPGCGRCGASEGPGPMQIEPVQIEPVQRS